MIALDAALEIVPIVAIMRRCPPEHVEAIAAAAAGAGITALEVTLDSPAPLESIAAAAAAAPSLSIGAGTVHDAAQVRSAAEAGAGFVVSPHLDIGVVGATKELGLVSIPGAATPSEIVSALDAGADLVKWFPAEQLGGPPTVAAVTGPLHSPPLMPTGGVDARNASAYLRAGAVAIGVGSSIFPHEALAAGDADLVGDLCRRLVAEVR